MATKSPKSTKNSYKKKPTKKQSSLFKYEKRVRTIGVIFALVLFAGVGSYLLNQSFADQKDDTAFSEHYKDKPERGVFWSGQRIAKTGPCKGMVEHKIDDSTNVGCSHPDEGPEGVDVRERAKDIEKIGAEMVEYDKTHPAKASDDPSTDEANSQTDSVSPADTGYRGDLTRFVSPRNWPCIGTGSDGARVQVVYMYVSGKTNRLSTFRAGFESTVKRVNAMYYNSGVDSGASRQVRFATGAKQSDGTCALSIGVVPVSSANVSTYDGVVNTLIAANYKSNNRKYLVYVDGGTSCGQGQMQVDDTAGPTNANNTNTSWAVAWYPCWYYSEPHELMHTMGAVQLTAPHHTPGAHCYDQHDKMCYNDGTGKSMVIVSACTSRISYTDSAGKVWYSDKYAWRFDCRHDDYFASVPAGTYLKTKWNAATTRFLYPNPQ